MRPLARSLSVAVPALAALLAIGCSSSEPEEDDFGAGEDALGSSALKVTMRIAESKEVYSQRVLSFGVKDSGTLDLGCANQAFNMVSKPSLYEQGWSPEQAAAFSPTVSGARYKSYLFASCRNAETQIFGWFARARGDSEYTVDDQFMAEGYDPAKLPLVLQRTPLGGGAPTYYSCSSAFKKTQTGENASEKLFDLEVTCRKRNAPTKAEMGPLDFVANPGPYAALASYKAWALPPLASNAQNFERVRSAFLGKVAAGNYTGAMSTLSKTCGLKIENNGNTLVVDHTIQSSNRTRHLELKAEDLLGFLEGDLYEDPIGVEGPTVGRFAAAEFRNGRGGTVVVRFEQNTTRDAAIVRINGAEAYCRRLVQP